MAGPVMGLDVLLKRSGVRVFACGRGDLGQLGQLLHTSTTTTGLGVPEEQPALEGCVLVPWEITELSHIAHVVHISPGTFNTAFLSVDGEVYTCGASDSGQLGVKSVASSTAVSSAAVRVDTLDLHKVVHVAYGQGHALAVTDKGLLLSWGASEFGQLGNGREGAMQAQPRVVKSSRSIRMAQVSAGACHSLGLSTSGQVYSWGQGTFGALGHGDEANAASPRHMERLWALGVVQVAAGENHSAALTADGRVLCWGRGKYGALGSGDFKSAAGPLEVGALQGLPLVQGQLGLGSVDNTCRPNRVQGALEGRRVVQVAAGLRHSAALTADNTVFLWGCGEQGQLGLGQALPSQLSPAPLSLQALPELPILFIAAGGEQTFMVVKEAEPGEQVPVGPVPSGVDVGPVAWPYGAALLPLPLPRLMQLAQSAATETAEAGETTRSLEGSMLGALLGGGTVASPVSPGQGGVVTRLMMACDDVFSSPGFLTCGFADPLPAKVHAGATPPVPGIQVAANKALQACGIPPHGMDVGAINAVYTAILKVYSTEVMAALAAACLSTLDMMSTLLGTAGDDDALCGHTSVDSNLNVAQRSHSFRLQPTTLLPALFILCFNPLNSEQLVFAPGSVASLGTTGSVSLMGRIVNVWVRLPPMAQQVLAYWLACAPADVVGGRVLRPLQRHITRCVERGWTWARPHVLRAAQVLYQLHDAQESLSELTCPWGSRVPLGVAPSPDTLVVAVAPLAEWHNKALSDAANLREEYMIFAQLASAGRPGMHHDYSNLVSLCQAPLLLVIEAKSRILQGEASMQKQHTVQSSAVNAILQGIDPVAVVYLRVAVRRDHILQDTLRALMDKPQDLKKPLRVTFIGPGGLPEEGVDEGGVSREFFQLLVAEVFKPDYGMFEWNEETRTFSFKQSSLESELEFQLVGIILGLAIYNNIILDTKLPLVTYKKLLGGTPGWSDLCEAQPTLARGLASLLEFEGDVEATFCRSFDVEVDHFGSLHHQELVPGGSALPVTATNRLQYVQLYTHWVLSGSIEKQFAAFAQGFHQVCGGLALGLLHPQELELLSAGLPHLDFNALEEGARYDGGYQASTPVVQWLWAELHTMNLEQKRRFLSFTTGCDRAPVGGLGSLTLGIQRAGPDSDRLPTSHTCFNMLLLPEYSSQSKLRERLLTAIENAQGFGLQ